MPVVSMMPADGQGFTAEEWQLKKQEIAKIKPKVLKHINQSKHMSQGFRLVNRKEYQADLEKLKSYLNSQQMRNTEEGKAAKLMYQILTDDQHLAEFLDDDLKQYLEDSPNGKRLNTKAMNWHGKNQVANAKLKRKQLFLMFKEIIQAQVELKTFSETIAAAFNGTLSQPPGAYGGIKSYEGALAKITTRVRSNDVGDLKDCARMTIKFNSIKDLQAAKLFIARTDEFRAVAHHQNALKDRYSFARAESKLSRFNVAPTDSGYRDIKFFLKLSGGQIAELQLNIPGMLIAKSKAHIIYDITRTTSDTSQTFEVTSPEVLAKVKRKMNDDWFGFVQSHVPGVGQELRLIQNMMSKMGQESLVVSPEEAEALNRVSRELYAQGLNGRALLED